MKIDLGIIQVFAAFLISYSSVCYGNEPLVTIQYPATFTEYYDFVSKLPQKSKASSMNFHNADKITLENLCIASLESKFFVYDDDKPKASVPTLKDRERMITLIQDWHTRARTVFARAKNIAEESILEMIPVLEVDVPGQLSKLEVMPCFIMPDGVGWYLASLFDSGTYFSVSKLPDTEAGILAPTFSVKGLLEPSPIINEVLSNDPAKLEEAFVAQVQTSADAGAKILKLTPFEAMRVCSGIYVAWNKKNNITIQGENTFKMISGVRGVWQATIILDHNPSMPSAKANLIACALNQEPEKPQFYVALDNNTKGGAYVFEIKQTYKFSLVMHVTEVIALKQK